MLSHQLVQEIDETLTRPTALRATLESVAKIANLEERVLGAVGATLLKQGGAADNSNEAAKVQMNEVAKEVRAIGMRRLFLGLDEIESSLIKFYDSLPDRGDVVRDQLVDSSRQFTEVYEKFLANSGVVELLQTVVSARSFYNRLITVIDNLALIRRNLEQRDTPLDTGVEQITIMLYTRDEYSLIIAKLEAVQTLYSEYCALLHISEAEVPLRVVKIETGSLWLKLLGSAAVIQLLAGSIKGAIQYMHRNYTREGPLVQLPLQGEVLLGIINLKRELEKAGIDTKEMGAELAKAGVIIAKSLNSFLGGEPSVVMNSERFELSLELSRHLLAQQKKPLLETNVDGSAVDRE